MTHRQILAPLLAALLASAALPVRAQEGGALVSLALSSGLSYSDVTGAPSQTLWGTDIDGRVTSETRNQRFSFAVGARIETGDTDTGESPDLTTPDVALDYAIFNRDIEASIALDWNEEDVDAQDLPDDFDADDLTEDAGSRETHSAALRLVTGRAMRFGTDTRLSFSELTYEDVTDPDLIDEQTLSAETHLRFSLSRQVELRTQLGWTETEDRDAVGAVETERRFGLGGDFLIDPALTAGLEILFVETETELGGVSTIDDAFDITATLTRFMPNGRLVFQAAHEIDDGNESTSLELTRALGLAGGGDLRVSFGLIGFETGDVQPLFGLDYNREVLRGQTVSLGLSQTGDQQDDGTVLSRTRLDGAYNVALTAQSRLSLTGSLASVIPQDGGTDTLRRTIGLSYRHDLTQDWALVASSDQRVTYENGTETDRDLAISINLERRFSFRP